MSEIPRLSPFKPPEPTTILMDFSPVQGEIPERPWRELLRPKLVEKAVLTADIIFILAASLIYNASYSWLATGEIAHLTTFAGLGIIVAVNFTAIMTARRNYHLKSLAQFYRQARDGIVVWSGVYGMLALVGFTMKISSEFSRGSVVLFFAGGLSTVLAFRFVIANLISQSLANGSFARKK